MGAGTSVVFVVIFIFIVMEHKYPIERGSGGRVSGKNRKDTGTSPHSLRDFGPSSRETSMLGVVILKRFQEVN